MHAGSCCLFSGRFLASVFFLLKFACDYCDESLFFGNGMILVWVLVSFGEVWYVEFSCLVRVFLFALDVQHVHRVFHCIMCMVCLQYILNLGSCAVYHSLVLYVLPCWQLTFRHRASCILGQAFHYSPENAFYIFNQQIYFIIWYLLDRASLI